MELFYVVSFVICLFVLDVLRIKREQKKEKEKEEEEKKINSLRPFKY